MKNSSNNKESVADSILSGAIKGLELWEDDGIGLDDYLDFYLKPADVRRTVSSILFEYFRNKALIDRVILNSVARPPQARYHRILAVVLTQAFFQSGISPESAANVAVDHVKAKYGKSPAGFINAVLRTALRNDIKSLMSNSSTPEFLFPASVFKRWKARFSDEILSSLADGLRSPASLTFRLCKDIPEELLTEADAVALTDLPWLGNLRFYECSSPGKIFTQSWLKEGKIYIQDPSTALAPGMAELTGNEKIIDMCAAPGGKSLILAERLGKDGKLVAADRSEQRQALTRENFKNHGFAHQVITASATELKFPDNSFDLVLADVPCSNTGVFRRRPDALWRFSEKRLEQIILLQRSILNAGAKLVADGGQLIYSTCSIEEEEDNFIVRNFLNEHPEFILEKQQMLLPGINHDGGYAARLRKVK